ncbi:MAG: Crp/Fnr family transcriptional regulator [Burkholderiales bacterium]
MDFAQCGVDTLCAALGADAWFAQCSAALQDALLAHSRPRRLGPGESLYRQGDAPAHALYCLLEGAVCVGGATIDGAASLVVYLEPFHWFGDVGLIDGLPRQHDAFADGDSVVLCVALAPFLDWLARHPAHWRDVARLSAYKLRVAYEVVSDPGALSQRLARRLWWMAHGFGSRVEQPTCQLKVSQALLAQMMGSSRQSINAALRVLEGEGFVRLHYRGVEVVDLDRLLRHVQINDGGRGRRALPIPWP